jgi:hypothetical protein
VPIPARQKAPRIRAWQHLRITEAEAATYFTGECNIGIILGKPSGGLIDIDLDCHEAINFAANFLPTTSAKFGRASKMNSHWLYQVQDFAPSLTFRDPKSGGTLLEFRGDGGRQTVFPPSIHPSGEAIAWAADGDPSIVDYADLRKSVTTLAARCLVARYIPEATDAASLLKYLGTADPRVAAKIREWLGLDATLMQKAALKPAVRSRITPAIIPGSCATHHPIITKRQRITEKTLRSFARSDLNYCVRKLKDQKEPGRANLLFRKSIRLGISIARGHLDQDEVTEALLDACVSNGLVAKNGEKDVRRQIERGFTCGATKLPEGTT